MIAGAAWFSRVGMPLASGELAAIGELLQFGLEAARVEIHGLAHWRDVGAVIRAADWDAVAWEREEEERQRLWQAASERLDEGVLLGRLTAMTDALAETLHGAAECAAARDGSADADLVAAAAGAAALAAQHGALAGLAGEDRGHYFVRRYALFAGGRWPLGAFRGQYLVF
jgi:hypothetical protein